MRKSRKFALAASACLTILAVATAGTIGILKVSALGNLTTDVEVAMTEPLTTGLTTVTIFTDDGEPPARLDLEVEAVAVPFDSDITVDGVDFALNAIGPLTFPTNINGTTADDVNAGVNDGGNNWSGLLNIGLIPRTDYTDITGGIAAPAVVSALASITNTYGMSPGRASVAAYDEFDSANVDVVIMDALLAGVDINANCKPDAQGLATYPEGTLVCTGASGNPIYTVWTELAGSVRGVLGEVSVAFNTPTGALFVDVTAPTLAQIKLASSAYSIYDRARLVVSVSAVDTDLLDGPAGVNPLGEFVGGNAPQNLFALVNILLNDSTSGDAVPQWLGLETLPGGLTISAEISGESVETALTSVPDVLAYTYDTTVMQVAAPMTGPLPASRGTFTLSALVDYGDEAGWTTLTDSLIGLSMTRVVPSAGDNTITIGLPSASVITASNATPALTGGGGGGGGGSCFIATAAYGTPLADDINVLRSLRDSYMLNNAVGMAFVDTYYRVSPSVADSVAGNAAVKNIVRTLLMPVVIVASFVLAMPGVSVLMLLALVGFVAVHVRRRTTRA